VSIELSSVSAGYDRTLVVHDVDLVVAPGEITVLIGPNGCGKSTLLKAIGRLVRPSRGSIAIDGRDIGRAPPRALGRLIAYLPQAPAVPTAITVEQLIGYGRAPHQSLLGFRSAADVAAVEEAMAATGMSALRDTPVTDLSGGQRQRAFIAMTLAQQTAYVMLDEPTTFLDIRHQYETLDLIRALNAGGRTSVVVLHDIGQAARYGDRLVVMKDGRIHASGRPRDVVTPAMIRQVYGLDCEVYDDPVSGTPAIARRTD
jgi:iron complex transport system ATP-binding protein